MTTRVLDFRSFKRRKYLENSIEELEGLVKTLTTSIIGLTKYNKYRSINMKLHELNTLLLDIKLSLDKKKEQLEMLNNEEVHSN